MAGCSEASSRRQWSQLCPGFSNRGFCLVLQKTQAQSRLAPWCSRLGARVLVLGFSARGLGLNHGRSPHLHPIVRMLPKLEPRTCVEHGRQCRQNQNADNSSHTNDREARGKRAGQPPVELAEGFAEPFLILS